jgi:hypothetical protein
MTGRFGKQVKFYGARAGDGPEQGSILYWRSEFDQAAAFDGLPSAFAHRHEAVLTWPPEAFAGGSNQWGSGFTRV